MRIQKLTEVQDLFESEHVLMTAFLHPWEEQKAREKSEALSGGNSPAGEERWGLFDDADALVASISTLPRKLAFGGAEVSAGEFHLVGSLPESRGGGNVRALMKEVLQDFAAHGDVFALLIPFSFAFYRKFGFELVARTYTQRVPLVGLASMRCDYAVTRVSDENDVAVVRSLYEAFARTRNMADLRGDDAWAYVGDGEFGERDFFHRDCTSYTYVLWDGEGTPHAYVTFIFVTGEGGPFVGELKVRDCAYDSPEALMGILGFLYRLRAKATHVSFELLDDVDLATMLPECGDVECTVGGHVMARLLDVPRALELMPHPRGEGSYSVQVNDTFMPQNSGTYRVTFANGHALSVQATDAVADMEVSEETLCQLVVGRIGLEDARYRAGTVVRSNEDMLSQVFVRRPVALTL